MLVRNNQSLRWESFWQAQQQQQQQSCVGITGASSSFPSPFLLLGGGVWRGGGGKRLRLRLLELTFQYLTNPAIWGCAQETIIIYRSVCVYLEEEIRGKTKRLVTGDVTRRKCRNSGRSKPPPPCPPLPPSLPSSGHRPLNKKIISNKAEPPRCWQKKLKETFSWRVVAITAIAATAAATAGTATSYNGWSAISGGFTPFPPFRALNWVSHQKQGLNFALLAFTTAIIQPLFFFLSFMYV